jgi:hypothetical protein
MRKNSIWPQIEEDRQYHQNHGLGFDYLVHQIGEIQELYAT